MKDSSAKYEFIKNKTCPYCQSKIKINADFIVCSYCGTPHHRECWDENSGCTTYGCRNNPATEKKVTIQSEDVGNLTPEQIRQSIENEEKKFTKCINCKSEIEEGSVYCKYCGFNQIEEKFTEASEEFEKEFKKRYKEKAGFSRKRFYLTLSSVIILIVSVSFLLYLSITRLNEYFSSDEYKIKAAIENWKDAWESKDLEKYKSYLTEDYQYYGKDGKPVELKERLKRLESVFKNTNEIKIKFSDIRIISDSSTTPNDKKVKMNQQYEAGKTMEKGVKILRVFRGEETNGEWKIYREFFE